MDADHTHVRLLVQDDPSISAILSVLPSIGVVARYIIVATTIVLVEERAPSQRISTDSIRAKKSGKRGLFAVVVLTFQEEHFLRHRHLRVVFLTVLLDIAEGLEQFVYAFRRYSSLFLRFPIECHPCLV